MFSAVPTDQEIFRARIFSEPLVPVMKTATAADLKVGTTTSTLRHVRLTAWQTSCSSRLRGLRAFVVALGI